MKTTAFRAPCARVAAIWLVGLLATGSASAADPAAGAAADDGPVYPVTWFDVRYGGEDQTDQNLPPLDALLSAPFELGRSQTGWVAPGPDAPAEPFPLPRAPGGPTLPLHASGLGALSRQLVDRLRDRGLIGVYVAPHEADIDLDSERDLRRPGDTVLRLLVEVGRVTQLRSIGFGDRLPPDWRIDNKIHRRIREGSPIQPAATAREDTTDLIDMDRLEEYLQRLSRHPGRRVEAALAPAEDGGVSLDYQVTESRPWYAYAQTSNTGTEETNEWQTRVGFVHQQLTNHDDILSLDYLNAGFNDVNGVNVGYEAPWFSSRRPKWLHSDDDNPWVSWLPRDQSQWWGSDYLRWRIFGSWSDTKFNDVSGTDDIESTEWDAGLELTYQMWQHHGLFLDGFLGFTTRAVDDKNDSAPNDASTVYMYLPEIGVRAERYDEISSLRAEISTQGTANRLDKDAELLGRIEPDRRWVLLLWDAEWSHYLEPVFNPGGWSDPSTPGSSTLAHEIHLATNGQWSFDRRLIPQAAQVIGGLYSVRGYKNSLSSGDSVAVGSFEYRYHLARSLPIHPKPVRLPYFGDFRLAPQQAYGRADWDLVLSAFVDAGHTWRVDVPSNSPEEDDTLIGVGVGAEFTLGGHLRARVDWGRALKSAGPQGDRTKNGDDRFHFLFSLLY